MAIIKERVTLKLLPGENIQTIQRKHLISIVLPLATCVLSVAILIAALIIFRFYAVMSPLFFIDAMLLTLSFLIIFSMFSIINWFYQFYVITNKRILYIRFFQTQRKHFEEVFFTAGTKLKISRVARNLLYIILNVEDVYIEFRRDDRKEPFIIQAPDRPQEIEEILDTLGNTSPLRDFPATAQPVEKS